MTFGGILKHLQAGRPIYRKAWGKTRALYHDASIQQFIDHDFNIGMDICDKYPSVTLDDLVASDWDYGKWSDDHIRDTTKKVKR